jgi:hypothetical protein
MFEKLCIITDPTVRVIKIWVTTMRETRKHPLGRPNMRRWIIFRCILDNWDVRIGGEQK